MRTRTLQITLWSMDREATIACHDGKKEKAEGILLAKKLLKAAMETEKEKRILRREKRKKNLAERA